MGSAAEFFERDRGRGAAGQPPPPPTAIFGDRFVAFFVDFAILAAAQWLVFVIASRQLQAVGMTEVSVCDIDDPQRLCVGPSDALWAILFVFLVVSTLAYHAWGDGVAGRTIGKRLAGLSVVESGGSGTIGFARGLIRSVLRQLPWLALILFVEVSPISLSNSGLLVVVVPFLATAGWLIGALRQDGAALHDMVAGSRVVPDSRVDRDPLGSTDNDYFPQRREGADV